MSLTTRVISVVSGVLIIAVATLIFSPATVSYPPTMHEIALGIFVALGILWLVWLGVIASLRPIYELRRQMSHSDELAEVRPIALNAGAAPELVDIASAYNELVERLQAEQRASRSAVLAGQEAERLRISRELHDQVGQSLTYALLSVQASADALPEGAERLELARESVRSSLAEVRALAANLRPGPLNDLGLSSAVTSLATDHAAATGAVVKRSIGSVVGTNHEQDLVIYRVAQEALTNVARHAQARHVWVDLAQTPDAVTLRVRDDGVGVSRGNVATGNVSAGNVSAGNALTGNGSTPALVDGAASLVSGIGVAGMRDRADMVGARFTIAERPGGGTAIELELPLKKPV